MEFYIIRGQKTHGPYSQEQVIRMLDAGDLDSTDLAWRTDLPKAWSPLSELIERVESNPYGLEGKIRIDPSELGRSGYEEVLEPKKESAPTGKTTTRKVLDALTLLLLLSAIIASIIYLPQVINPTPEQTVLPSQIKPDESDKNNPQDLKPPTAFELATTQANSGNASAMLRVAHMYRDGNGTGADAAKATTWLTKAAENNHTEAAYELAMIHGRGDGVAQDIQATLRWMEKAASLGHVDAQLRLGTMFEDGNGTDPDPKAAMQWYQKAADQGNAKAIHSVGKLSEDLQEKFALFRKAAEMGLPEAMFGVGFAHELGIGAERDIAEAAKWYRKGAENGSTEAQVRFARMYASGEGVEKNEKEAFAWFLKAAEGGHAMSQTIVSFELSVGRHVPEDQNASAKWAQRAAEQGFTRGQLMWADHLINAKGTTRNLDEALRLSKLALQEDDEVMADRAKYNIYRLNLLLKASLTSGFKNAELRAKAEGGDREAQYQMGLVTEWSVGEEASDEAALDWYRKSAIEGFAPGQHELAKKMLSKANTERKQKAVLELLTGAANQNYPPAMLELSRALRNGIGGEANPERALSLVQKMAEGGDSDGQYQLGWQQLNGIGAPRNISAGAVWVRRAAIQGNAQAQHLLGELYAAGDGFEQDDLEAYEWFLKAANQGNTAAMLALGVAHATGRGKQQDQKQAVHWYTKAAKRGNEEAQFYIGNRSLEGKGLDKDERKAVEWFFKSAEKGHHGAQYQLGLLYAQGKAVERNLNFSLRMLKKAAASDNKQISGLADGKIKSINSLLEAGIPEKFHSQTLIKSAQEGNAKAQYHMGLLHLVGLEPDFDVNIDRSIQFLTKAALQGEVEAQHELGRIHRFAKGVEQDYDEAFKWLKMAWEKNHSGASYLLSDMFIHGRGVDRNLKIGMNLLEKARISADPQISQFAVFDLAVCRRILKAGIPHDYDPRKIFTAADGGNAVAQYQLGMLLKEGVGVPENKELAETWFRKAAANESLPAMIELGKMYYFGNGVAEDVDEAIKWFVKAGKEGNPAGFYFVGFAHAIGDGAPRDPAKAVEFYTVAAKGGNASGQYQLGMAYLNGVGVEKNLAKAAENFALAAKQNDKGAAYYLADMLLEGRGVTKNTESGFDWMVKAAQLGDNRAQTRVGQIYENGSITERNLGQAYLWYRRASEQDDAVAQYFLARMLDEGRGVEEDVGAAIQWYRKSAMQNDADSQYKLALLFQSDRGGDPELIPAYAWFTVAAANKGDWLLDPEVKSRAAILALAPRMTGGQIAEALKRVKNITQEIKDAESGNTGNQEQGGRPTGTGSGFFITNNGYLMTNHHVIEGGRRFIIQTTDGKRFAATLVKANPKLDLAILKVNGRFPSLPLATSNGLPLGHPVFTIGFPDPKVLGIQPKFTKGELSSLKGVRDDPNRMQISVPVQPGNSGGPLADNMGNVVGVIVSRLNAQWTLENSGFIPQNINYAVNGQAALDFVRSVPAAAGQLNPPNRTPVGDPVKNVQRAVALIMVYGN
ncbi:MAG: hypothetical protein CMJ70_21630 [Planctomycetaceae bacterium]|nr:hypothetical protein [Planctomycetaceae bacterium]